MVDGREMSCRGSRVVEMVVWERKIRLCTIVINRVVDGVDMVMDMDMINYRESVTVIEDRVTFGGAWTSCVVM